MSQVNNAKKIGILVPVGANDLELSVFSLFLRTAFSEYVVLVSLSKQLTIETQANIKLTCNEKIECSNLSKFNYLILISSDWLNLEKVIKHSYIEEYEPKIPKINRQLQRFFEEAKPNKYLVATNTAPIYLDSLGFLENRKFTYNNTKTTVNLKGSVFKSDDNRELNIVEDNNLITANSSQKAVDLALWIIEEIKGKEESKRLQKELLGI